VRLLVRLLAGLALALVPLSTAGRAAPPLPEPAARLGFEPCADYKLATYEAIDDYFRVLDAASDRLALVEIGKSVEGRPLRLAIISSPRNLARLERYRDIAATLARGRRDGALLTDADARALAEGGRAVVWVDFGLHSTEVAHSQAAPLFAWRMVSGETPEIRRMRDEVILLLMPNMNPDGTTQVANWYMQHVGTPFEKAPLPELYHRYVGHDNNRDWFMLTQPESQAVARQLYHVWYPQIVYNQHQEPPFPARIFVPPFEDPVNPNIPPLVVRGINTVGDAITRRLEQEGKTGAISRMQYDAWWNGGMRTSPYFHNMVGILTETAHASASPATYDPAKFPRTFPTGLSTSEPSVFYPSPYRGGRWTLRDSCEYMLTASMAVMDVGARRRTEWLYDIYKMGRDQIRAGAAETFVIPAAQWDPPTAVALVNTLLRGGVEIAQATEAFDAGGQRYEAGAYVIRGAQPFRAYLRDLLLPQRYPDMRLYPGGPPDRPYDITGWTLPLQMGVRVDEVAAAVEVATDPVVIATSPAADVPGLDRAALFVIDGRVNNSVRLVNQLLGAGVRVERLASPIDVSGDRWPAGAFLVEATDASRSALHAAVRADGVRASALAEAPAGPRLQVRPRRLGLYRPWGGNIDEGWTRYVLEQFGFTPAAVRDTDIREGRLASRFDTLILPDASYQSLLTGLSPATMPAEYTGGLGPRGVAALYEFIEAGGTLVTLDSASELPLTAFGLPIANVTAGLRETEFSIPGSLLRVEVDTTHPLAWGVPAQVSAFFANGLAFRPTTGSSGDSREWPPTAHVVASYAREGLLQSGWQLGGDRLGGQGALVDMQVGRGRLVLIGFRAQHRAQPHATFKFLFNALLTPSPPERPGG
jgi:hypothetical protein